MIPEKEAVVTVSEMNRQVRKLVEAEFPLLWVAGEVSNLTRATSGHVYFSLKDNLAQVRCVMFRSRAQAIPWRIENGHQVEVRALATLYEARGEFQLGIEAIRPAGQGKLYEAFAKLKERLEVEGLFSQARKRAMPSYARTIGIVSSPHAAALRDVIATLTRRAPHLRVILYPCLVQGEAAAGSIVDALASACKRRECDALLVVRGGGSIEDLWAFNEESVARAIAASSIPTICGIGHETDQTIADFVADLRAATPTAAAEIVSQAWSMAPQHLAVVRRLIFRAVTRQLENKDQALDHIAVRLMHPAMRIARAHDSLALYAARLKSAIPRSMNLRYSRLSSADLALARAVPRLSAAGAQVGLISQRLIAEMQRGNAERLNRLDRLAAALNHLNPEAILARGFAIVRDSGNRILSDAAQLVPGQFINLRLASGDADAVVHSTHPSTPPLQGH